MLSLIDDRVKRGYLSTIAPVERFLNNFPNARPHLNRNLCAASVGALSLLFASHVGLFIQLANADKYPLPHPHYASVTNPRKSPREIDHAVNRIGTKLLLPHSDILLLDGGIAVVVCTGLRHTLGDLLPSNLLQDGRVIDDHETLSSTEEVVGGKTQVGAAVVFYRVEEELYLKERLSVNDPKEFCVC